MCVHEGVVHPLGTLGTPGLDSSLSLYSYPVRVSTHTWPLFTIHWKRFFSLSLSLYLSSRLLVQWHVCIFTHQSTRYTHVNVTSTRARFGSHRTVNRSDRICFGTPRRERDQISSLEGNPWYMGPSMDIIRVMVMTAKFAAGGGWRARKNLWGGFCVEMLIIWWLLSRLVGWYNWDL